MRLNRRNLIKVVGLTGLSMVTGVPYGSYGHSRLQRRKVVVVGGGTSGVCMSWLLDQSCDVTLIEKNPFLGGHAQTIPVEIGQRKRPVDIGAEFVSYKTHPVYMRLLQVVGLHDPKKPKNGEMFSKKMSVTIFNRNGQLPLHFSPVFYDRIEPLLQKWNWESLRTFSVLATKLRELEYVNRSWDVSVEDFIKELDVSRAQKENIVQALCTAMCGCSTEEAKQFSARAAFVFVSRASSKNPLKSIEYYNSNIGLGGNLQHIISDCKSLSYSLGETVQSVHRINDQLRIVTDKRELWADDVVFSCPPYAAKNILRDVIDADPLVRTLSDFKYFESQISLHRDPIYMHPKRRYWSTSNISVGDERSENSIWQSYLMDEDSLLFKSWTTGRDQQPRELVAERKFMHPLISPDFVKAQNQLDQFQGMGNIWFAASYCNDVDSQDTAVRSAMRVAAQLAPDSKNLRRLETVAHPGQ